MAKKVSILSISVVISFVAVFFMVTVFAAAITVSWMLSPVGASVFVLYVLGVPAAYALYHVPGDIRNMMEDYRWMLRD